METDNEANFSVQKCNQGSRKQKKVETKRHNQKLQRYIHGDPNVKKFKKPCIHENGPSFFCNNLTFHDIKHIRHKFYKKNSKIEQDIKLGHLISVVPIKRKRSAKENPKNRSFTVNYFLPTRIQKTKVKVCQHFFLNALNIKKDRMNRVAKFIFAGEVPKERRGGDHVSKNNENRKDKVREFLKNLEENESYYSRAKSKKIYLSSSLNIKKLHELYQNQCDEVNKVHFQMFRKIFVNEFDIGFSSPTSDCFAKYTNLKHQIKVTKDDDDDKRQNLKLELNNHKEYSNTFYDALKQNPQHFVLLRPPASPASSSNTD